MDGSKNVKQGLRVGWFEAAALVAFGAVATLVLTGELDAVALIWTLVLIYFVWMARGAIEQARRFRPVEPPGTWAVTLWANIALMALAFARGDMPKALSYPIPILSFFVGIVFAAQLRERISGIRRFRWEAAILLMEAALLFLVGLVPLTYAHAPVNVLVTFICAVQYEIFRETRGLPYASIFCTGNLRSAAEHFHAFAAKRDRTAGEACLHYILVILAFAVGVFGGAHLSNLLGARSIWVCCLMLFALVPIMFKR